MTNIKIIIEGESSPINYVEKEKNYINIEKVLFILQNEKNINKDKVKFIRRLNHKYNAWMAFNEDEKIEFDKEEDIKILVETKDEIDEVQNNKKKEIIKKINDISEKVDNELSNLNNKSELKTPKKQNSNLIPEAPDSDYSTINENVEDNLEIDIIVLTANPLIDKKDTKDGSEEKELRTMNDFNSVTYSISKVLDFCNKQIRVQFLPLTQSNFQDSIKQKPKIMHLICKSTYELENNIKNENNNNNNIKGNNYVANLLFENEKCAVERVNEQKINEIINSEELLKKDKNILKNINLFISTPLAEDVYEIFKKYAFKNIIVQHTTLANIDCISELNEQLYKYIIDQNKIIKEAFETAKQDCKNCLHYQFCCCFHRHNNDCKLKQNLSNELYFLNDNNSNLEIYTIPHFSHLRYQCKCKEKEADFCKHNKCDNCKYSFKVLLTKKTGCKNICCCDSLKNVHKLENAFFCKFSDSKNEEGLFSNYQGNNFCTIINLEFVPSYDKMKLIVGRNRVVYNIFDNLNDKNNNIINIYGKDYNQSVNKVDLFIDCIMEFLKERIPYVVPNLSQLNLIKGESSELQLIKKNTFNNNLKYKYPTIKDKIDSDNLIIHPMESSPALNKIKIYPTFGKIYFRIEQDNSINMINDIKAEKIFENKIFFINGYRISNEELIKILKKEDLNDLQIVIFKEKEFSENEKKEFNNINIVNLPLESLQKNDYAINIQNQKITLTKEDFDAKIDKILEYNRIEKEDLLAQSIVFYKDLEIINLSYEILFLFNCSNSGYFEMEMKALYQQNYDQVTKLIKEKYIPKRVISKIEQNYIRYIGNQPNFNNYYKSKENKINKKIKQIVLEKLFGFYAYTFRYLLGEAKKKNEIKQKIKKYKPNKSLSSFSAIQELGMWLPFEMIKPYDFKNYKIDSIIGFFKHLLRNFKNMFKNDNIFLCMKNTEIWKNVQDNIEDISITLPTLLKMCQCYDNKLISLISNVLQKEDKYLHPSYLRFQLFDIMSFEYDNHQKKYLENLEKIEYGFKILGYSQGELETLFAKCIVNFRENNNWKIFDNIFKSQIIPKIVELQNNNYPIENKDIFLNLFENKVRYKYIKYKISCGILLEEELSDLKKMINTFKEANNYFYIIKTCFLISKWYLEKYKHDNRMGKEDNNDNKKNHINYLNFGFFFSIKTKDEKICYIDYAKEFIIKKFNIEKQNESKEVTEEVKKLCNEYNIKYNIKNIKEEIHWFIPN